MKKFGTPNGAGPGNENENVGFAAVGTPPVPLNLLVGVLPVLVGEVELLGVLAFGFLCTFGCSPAIGFTWWFTDGGWVLAPPWLCGVDCGVVDGVVDGVKLVAVLVVGVESDAQLSVTAATGPETGNGIDETGVPGGTFTVKVNF